MPTDGDWVIKLCMDIKRSGVLCTKIILDLRADNLTIVVKPYELKYVK